MRGGTSGRETIRAALQTGTKSVTAGPILRPERERSYEQRQQDPGDYDAWVSQGPRNIHSRENLGFTDRGVAKVRRKLRAAIRNVAAGGDARSHPRLQCPIPTYGGDTMLRIKPQTGRDDAAVLKEVAARRAQIYQRAMGFKKCKA